MSNNFGRPLQTPIPQAALDDMSKTEQQPINVQLVDEEGSSLEEEIPEEEPLEQAPHTANLAEYLKDQDLNKLASDVIAMYDADVMARRDWELTYTKGLDLLGLKYEERTDPWPGAAGVFHPVLAEAVIRFQAQTMSECFPASGPAMPQIGGKALPDKVKKSRRVSDEVNHYCTNVMPEYRAENEQMLFRLPLAGSAFKKIYKDDNTNLPVAMFVPAEDFVAPYGASNLANCERYTHLMRRTVNEVERDMASGMYRKIDLTTPSRTINVIDEKKQKLTGIRSTIEYDDRHHILEMHVTMRIPGVDGDEEFAKPYVVTVVKDDSKVLAIRRNWAEEDTTFTRFQYFVHYPYLPGMGLYGTGLIHIVGGLAKSATSILRQLIDAGTLSNLPAGFKARGLRIKSEDQSPLRPGEFRDIDVPGQAIRDNLYPLPIKEPSAVLLQLLQGIVDEARRIGSVADLKVTDLSSQAPVGTVLALLERSMKVQSGVQARVHAALKQELALLYGIIGSLEGDYLHETDEENVNRQQDFADCRAVIPVSDPNATTMSQRVVQYQAAMDFSQRAPDVYDQARLHYQCISVLGIKDAENIVKLPEEAILTDPVTENMALLTMKPTKAFLQQDHGAHIAVHMAMAQDPKIQEMIGQSPNAVAIQSAVAAHVAEHIAYQYRTEIEKMTGAPLPPPGTPLPDDVEAGMSRVVAQAAGKLLEQSKAQVAQQKAQEAMQDPMVQIELQKLQNAKDEVSRKKAKDAIDAIMKMREIVGKENIDTARIASDLITSMADISHSHVDTAHKAATDLVKTATQARTARDKTRADSKKKANAGTA